MQKSNAESLFSACSEFKFIMPLIATTHVLNYAKAPTEQLQSVATDIVNGYKEIDLLKSTLVSVRENIDDYHKIWYVEASVLAGLVGTSPTMPRTCPRQTKRDNQPADNPETYYRITITSQLLDHLINYHYGLILVN